jgi:hypothetical protein
MRPIADSGKAKVRYGSRDNPRAMIFERKSV